MLQTGSAAIGEIGVATIAQAENLLQIVQRLAYRTGVRIGAKEAPGQIPTAAIHRQTREVVTTRQPKIRKALVVAQHHVVLRVQRLDQIVLEQQRLGLGARHRHLHRGDLRDERLHFRDDVRRQKITADAVAQALRLAYVEQRAIGGEHAIYARSTRQAADEFFGIEAGAHQAASCWARASTAWNISAVKRRVCVL